LAAKQKTALQELQSGAIEALAAGARKGSAQAA
jgi:hypothetical protein